MNVSLQGLSATSAYAAPQKSSRTDSLTASAARDRLELGHGTKVSQEQAQGMVLERAMNQLRSIVDQARADLGLPESGALDTSPEATANRIADFALGFFSKYAENNGLADDEAGRAQYAEFIGGAVSQGIEEARGILEALSVLSPDISSGIDQTASVVQARFDDFVANGLS